jgi:hypothetical protein
MPPAGDSARVVSTAGALDGTVATLLEFLHRSGALRVVALVECEASGPAVIDCGRFAPVEIEVGDELLQLPHDAPLAVPPAQLGEVRQLPPFEVDPVRGEVAGMVGGLAHATDCVRALAETLGEHNVAMAVYETDRPDAPLTLTVRAGGDEPVVVTLGEEQFELPAEGF